MVDRRDPDASAALIARADRRGRLLWSIPKGHPEAGETLLETAIREVAEETGILGSPLGELGTVDYWFVAGGTRIHKTVHHYLLVAESGSLAAQEIEVDQVAWVPLAETVARLAYPAERALAATAVELLK